MASTFKILAAFHADGFLTLVTQNDRNPAEIQLRFARLLSDLRDEHLPYHAAPALVWTMKEAALFYGEMMEKAAKELDADAEGREEK